MSKRPVIAALASAVAVAAVATGALVAQGTAAADGPATPERAVTAFIEGMAAGDPATCELLTPEARAVALADMPGRSCEEAVALVGEQPWMDAFTAGRTSVTSAGDDHAVVRFELGADVLWFRAVSGPQGWLLQRGPWDDAEAA